MKLTRTLVFLFIILPAVSLFPQDIDKKIKNIKGDVQKITITTSDGTIEIEGEEATYLFKKLKRKSFDKNIELHIEGVEDDSASDGKKSVIIKKDGEKVRIRMKPGSFKDGILDSLKKTVKVSHDDSGLNIVIVTYENGEKMVKTLSGKEAEEYLEDSIESDLLNDIELEIEKEKGNKKIIIKTEKKKISE